MPPNVSPWALAAAFSTPLSEGLVRATLDSLGEGVLLQASDSSIIEANEAAPRILGLSRDQLMDAVWHYSFYTDTSTVTGHSASGSSLRPTPDSCSGR